MGLRPTASSLGGIGMMTCSRDLQRMDAWGLTWGEDDPRSPVGKLKLLRG